MHTLEVTVSNSITTCYFVKKRSWGKKRKSKHTLLNFCFLECKWKECTWRPCRDRMPLQVRDHQTLPKEQPAQRQQLWILDEFVSSISYSRELHLEVFSYWQLNYNFPNTSEKIIIKNHIASTLCIKYHLE